MSPLPPAEKTVIQVLRGLGLLSALLSAPAPAGEPEWKALNDQVVPHLTGGSLDKAEHFARQGRR